MTVLRWLIVALCVVLVLAMLGYARGERQRGDTESAAAVVTVVSGRAAVA